MFTRFLPAIAIVALAVLRGTAFAESADVAKHFALGNDFYAEGRYADALVEYDTAYALSHNWKILYNRGQCLVLLKREPDAIRTFERYLADGGEHIDPERRAAVEADLVKLRARLGKLHLRGVPKGAEVTIDGHEITEPFDAIDIGAGEHALDVTPNDGRAAVHMEVSVAAGTVVEQTIELPPLPESTPPPPPPPLPDRGFYAGFGAAYLTGGNPLSGCAKRACTVSSKLSTEWLTGRLGLQATPRFGVELAIGAILGMKTSTQHTADEQAIFHEDGTSNQDSTRASFTTTDDLTFAPSPTLSINTVFTPLHRTFRLSIVIGTGFTIGGFDLRRRAGEAWIGGRSVSTPATPGEDNGSQIMVFFDSELRASIALPLDIEVGLSAGTFLGLPDARPTPSVLSDPTTYDGKSGRAIISTPDMETAPFFTFMTSLFVVKRFGR